MKKNSCESCGARGLYLDNGYLTCSYCLSTFIPTLEDVPSMSTEIDLDADVQRLLNLMKTDPVNAGWYANLVLDIDPTNQDIINYI